MSDGYIIVASMRYPFYESACYCAETLKDYYPEASVTLFTHEDWVDFKADVFDNVITGVPSNNRAKLWALSKSPYDRTMYLDADCEIMHEDISTVFDTIGDDHITVSKVYPYMAAVSTFPGGELTHHMGVFVYKKDPQLYEMFDQWYTMYIKQRTEPWDLDDKLYPKDILFQWDMFTWWRLINIEGWGDRIRVGFWDDGPRWNFHNLRANENKDPIIVYHHTLPNINNALNKPSEPDYN